MWSHPRQHSSNAKQSKKNMWDLSLNLNTTADQQGFGQISPMSVRSQTSTASTAFFRNQESIAWKKSELERNQQIEMQLKSLQGQTQNQNHPSSSSTTTSFAIPPTPTTTNNTNTNITSTPSTVGRVKVGVRVRPPFKAEATHNQFYLSANVPLSSSIQNSNDAVLRSVLLGRPKSNKQRDFMFDYTFSPNDNQKTVFDVVALPIVKDVLNGYNGTVFAYGQTGTGKTYTMGILEQVNESEVIVQERDGIIPRAMQQMFAHKESKREAGEFDVSLSFIQIYCETIQDLLAPQQQYGYNNDVNDSSTKVNVNVTNSTDTTTTTNNNHNNNNNNSIDIDYTNLPIREDKRKGFYIQHLHEFEVGSYSEASALVNLGLENRIMAPTLMNTTSSRSHTVLTLHVRQFLPEQNRRMKSKLLLVDLAGSERIKRTISQDLRLKEAQSINSSLAALGNVIAALAKNSSKHVPFRDSKLTRLLQDSLGGSASTALIATVGPAPINEAESLSTLQFASRCMQVKSVPVLHEEIDYAELCARLQTQLNSKSELFIQKSTQSQERYEGIIHKLAKELRQMRGSEKNENNEYPNPNPQSSSSLSISTLIDNVSSTPGWGTKSHDAVLTCIDLLYKMLTKSYDQSAEFLEKYSSFVDEKDAWLQEKYKLMHDNEQIRNNEMESMKKFDKGKTSILQSLGPHLGHLNLKESRKRIAERWKGGVVVGEGTLRQHPAFEEFESTHDLIKYCETLFDIMRTNFDKSQVCLCDTMENYYENADELASLVVERRCREEEVVNWSFVLKYLLSTTSKLKGELKGRGSLSGMLGGGGEGGGSGIASGSSAAVAMATPISKVGSNSKNNNNNHNMSPESARKIVPNQQVAQALIDKVKGMSEADINKLPEEVQANVKRLRMEMSKRANVKLVGKVERRRGGEEQEEEEEEEEEEDSSSDEDDNFSQI